MDSLKLPKPRQLSEPHGMDASLDSQMNAHSTMETIPFQLQGSNDAGIPLGYCLEVILGLGQLLEKDNVCASYLLKCKELSIVMKLPGYSDVRKCINNEDGPITHAKLAEFVFFMVTDTMMEDHTPTDDDDDDAEINILERTTLVELRKVATNTWEVVLKHTQTHAN